MSDEKNDPVEHPAHYTRGALEVIDAIEGLGLDRDFLLANVVKYVARSAHKGSELTDLRKSRWYLDRKIQKIATAAARAAADLAEAAAATVIGAPAAREIRDGAARAPLRVGDRVRRLGCVVGFSPAGARVRWDGESAVYVYPRDAWWIVRDEAAQARPPCARCLTRPAKPDAAWCAECAAPYLSEPPQAAT